VTAAWRGSVDLRSRVHERERNRAARPRVGGERWRRQRNPNRRGLSRQSSGFSLWFENLGSLKDGSRWKTYCSICGAQVSRNGLKSHRLESHPEVVQALDLAEKSFYRRYGRLVIPPIAVWLLAFVFSVVYLFDRVPWWHALLAVLVDSVILIPFVAGVFARGNWVRRVEPLQHVQVSCPLCASRTERREFLSHLSEKHPSAARLAKLSRSGGMVLIVAVLIVPLGIDNLVLFGWLPDSYLVTAVPLMFFMALALIVWLIIAKVLWERRIKAFSNAVR